ncbi:hypothetical protein [Salipiger mucosus]|uniref:Uncharacterized protein n=1 Tax=Salipiger mucosus DSM 16094 TaxID=1123237 RepID=S9QYX0_9RHOB|nr:hypothetical protein [Salipiger mucosus]EPX84797.1 hypothetical protein Salmuc_01370 [Salipiger mucosus DSM 16094]
MSFHNKPEWNPPELRDELLRNGLSPDTPSQLSDAFRLGWFAAKQHEEKGT